MFRVTTNLLSAKTFILDKTKFVLSLDKESFLKSKSHEILESKVKVMLGWTSCPWTTFYYSVVL